jgi:hypothetical protein
LRATLDRVFVSEDVANEKLWLELQALAWNTNRCVSASRA